MVIPYAEPLDFVSLSTQEEIWTHIFHCVCSQVVSPSILTGKLAVTEPYAATHTSHPGTLLCSGAQPPLQQVPLCSDITATVPRWETILWTSHSVRFMLEIGISLAICQNSRAFACQTDDSVSSSHRRIDGTTIHPSRSQSKKQYNYLCEGQNLSTQRRMAWGVGKLGRLLRLRSRFARQNGFAFTSP